MCPYCLACLFVHMITGLVVNDTGVCERHFTLIVNSLKVKKLNLTCCPDFYLHNGTCQPCYAGNFGYECKENCIDNQFGIQCKQTCNCSSAEICHSVHGCICKNCSENTLSAIDASSTLSVPGEGFGVSELTIILPESTNGWLTPHNLSNSQDEKAALQLIQVYTIITAAMLLLIVIVAVSVKIKRCAYKRKYRTVHMDKKTKETSYIVKPGNNCNLV